MTKRRSRSKDLHNVLVLERCPRSVQRLLRVLAKQGEFRILEADPYRCVFWADIDAYSSAGSGPDHGA